MGLSLSSLVTGRTATREKPLRSRTRREATLLASGLTITPIPGGVGEPH